METQNKPHGNTGNLNAARGMTEAAKQAYEKACQQCDECQKNLMMAQQKLRMAANKGQNSPEYQAYKTAMSALADAQKKKMMAKQKMG